MEKIKTAKNIIKKWPRRTAAVLTLALIGVLILGQYVFATGSVAIRTAHKIEAGDSTYCFSVQKNVVITPEEVAELTADEELMNEIFSRSGLFVQETSCRIDEHPPITMEEWLRDGNTFSLSENDIALIRQAAPEEGRPVKLHLDVLFTLQYDEDKAKEQGDVSGNAGDSTPEDQEGDASGNADHEGDASGNADEEIPFERPVYSTYKLTSPELLFVVIAAGPDSQVPEDECEEPQAPEEPDIPEEPEIPDIPEIDIDIPDIPEDMLPEYRKIDMVDKSGKPIPPALEDGDPVELIWIEPKTIDMDTARGWIEKYPGGLAGLGGTIAALGAGIAAIAYAVNKRKDEDD